MLLPSHRPQMRSAPDVADELSFSRQILHWVVAPFDYRWIFNHHTTRPMYTPLRFLLAGALLSVLVCSVLLLSSERAPTDLRMHAVQAVCGLLLLAVVATLITPIRFVIANARIILVAFLILCDGLMITLQLAIGPIAALFSCIIYIIINTYCVYFVSSRWLLVHLVLSTSMIALAGFRLYHQQLADGFAATGAVILMFTAVNVTSTLCHLAWSVLRVDAQQSLLDPLTGLRNRRGIEAALEPLWQQAVRRSTSVGLAILDLDNFKKVNDTGGHDAGDLLLRDVAQRLSRIADGRGIVGRSGGEEFTMIISGDALTLRTYFSAIPALFVDSDDVWNMRVSVGASIVTHICTESMGDVIRRAQRDADGRMYVAKQRGGNQASVGVLSATPS